MTGEPLRRCRKCGVDLPMSAFGRRKDGRDGVSSRCRACNTAASAAWKAANPERARELYTRSNLRRRALKLSVPSEPYTLDEIYTRDRGRCGLCRRPITRNPKAPRMRRRVCPGFG